MRVAEVDARLVALAGDGVPLLVFRLPALERTAWRNGLRAARSIERRASAAFAAAAARILRSSDLTGHDRGADAFVAALIAPTRDGRRWPAPVDIRSTLARIAATIEGLTALDVDAGWTRYDAQSARGIEAAIAAALVRGAQERERYAFFSALGHELRTPLASIRGYLETLLAEDADPATRQHFVRIAYGESLRLQRLLEGMFEISLLDLSATFPLGADGLLDAALSGAADASAALATEHGVALALTPGPPVRVAMDGDRLMLVLINLIANAIKHGRRGGRVAVTSERDASRTVTILVDDDGPGIPPHERERVFALGARGRTRAGGSGIGLALVRMILERAGGRVEIRGSPLGGARFAVTVPLADSVPGQRNGAPALSVMRAMGTDFRNGRDFPRRGRDGIDGFLWLARVFDKARAARIDALHDYIYPCPMDRGVFDRWGITSRMFDAALDSCDSDDAILSWVRARVTDERRDEANRWLLEERSANLDRLDAEEGFVAV
ncbi:MAG TPA: ATP-binding protein [Candidatus Lustribacter sp.]|nr:ATP-binding protein [Candidatus Lustribacter sp.]